MNKIGFLCLMHGLIEKFNINRSNILFEEIKNLFENYLKENTFDTEIRIKYVLFIYLEQDDEVGARECLQKVLEYDSENIISKILLAYIANYSTYVDKQIFELICSVKTSDKELLSITEYAKSWYYYHNDKKMYEKVLLKSIDYCDTFVLNYKHLGIYYWLEEAAYKKAHYCFQQALKNVKHVFNINDKYDALSIECFFASRLKGTIITEPNIESIQEYLNNCKQAI